MSAILFKARNQSWNLGGNYQNYSFLLEMFYSEGLDLIWRLLGGPIFSTIGFVSFDDTELYFDTYFWIQSKAI